MNPTNSPAIRNDPKAILALVESTPWPPSSLKNKRGPLPESGADQWVLTSPLTNEERSILGRLELQLSALMEAATEAERKAALMPLWFAFTWPAADDADEIRGRRLAFSLALDGIPAWAIERAVEDFVKGRDDRKNRSFPPSPAEVSERARQIHRIPMMRQLWEVRKYKQARVEPVATDAERERMQSRVSDILARFRPTTEAAE
jgi:hypothetical protein